MATDALSGVGTVLRYFHEEVVPALAAALVIDDNFPEEVLNEIRNSFTHLAHASVLDPTSTQEIASELEAAKQHLQRVCYDSFKICILVTP